LETIELATLEHSMLVNALNQKSFGAVQFQQFIALGAQQQTYQDMIKTLMTEEQSLFFTQTVTGEPIKETNKIRLSRNLSG